MTRLNLATRSCSVAVLVALAAAVGAAELPRPPLSQIDKALQAGEADRALAMLKSLPSGSDRAEAYNLECRVRYTLQQWDAAAAACQKAVNLDGQNANYHMWLGRALGEKASRASFLSAFSLARRVCAEFQKATQLNPRNAAALADLGDFYRSAPGIVGGGLDKAESVALELDRLDPARAHQLRARIAEDRKNYGTAEREFKQAIASSAHPAFQWTPLADFYRRRKRWTEMEWAVRSSIKAAEHDGKAGVPLYDGASILIDANRDLPLAAKMLEDYVGGHAKTEEAPAFAAYTRLARVEQRLGDLAAARKARASALELAHEYKPALELKMQEPGH